MKAASQFTSGGGGSIEPSGQTPPICVSRHKADGQSRPHMCVVPPTMAYHWNHMSRGVPNKGTKSEVHNPCPKGLLSFFSIPGGDKF